MDCVLTLIANPAKPCLDQAMMNRTCEILSQKYDQIEIKTDTLGKNIAVDFFFSGNRPNDLVDEISSMLNAQIDVICQPVANREKSLLIADMDSTIIEQECLDELANFAGLETEISAITERAMRGELDFEAALKERVGMLKDLPISKLQETLETRLSLTPGANELVRTMNARGAVTALVSGGFTFFTHRIAQAVGFQENQGNVLEMDGDRLTGTVEEPILGRVTKREALETLCEFNGFSQEEALAVGDGANDLDMLRAAGTGVAFHAKAAVTAGAKFRIDHSDLTALLYLQGIRQSEFVKD